MNRKLRPYLGLMLALMLALTGQSMAVARGMSGPAGDMVLCTGSGPINVQVDENGQPVGPPHICPDCALLLFAMAPVLPVMPVRPLARGVRLDQDAAQLGASRREVLAVARGPPQG